MPRCGPGTRQAHFAGAQRGRTEKWKVGGSAGSPYPTASEERGTVRSRIDGEWKGWDGNTVVTLVNGSVWQQDEYYYRYQYKYRPEVIVEGNLMHIDGMPKAVRVRRLS